MNYATDMTAHVDPRETLGALNARRFALMLALLDAGKPLGTSEIADRLPVRQRASVHRDLAALESVDLVVGEPAPADRQQGKPIVYRAHGSVILDTFASLHQQVADLM